MQQELFTVIVSTERHLPLGQALPGPAARLALGLEFVLQLLLADFGQQRPQGWPGLHAQDDQIVSLQKRWADF